MDGRPPVACVIFSIDLLRRKPQRPLWEATFESNKPLQGLVHIYQQAAAL
jgi:hypothetical protein